LLSVTVEPVRRTLPSLHRTAGTQVLPVLSRLVAAAAEVFRAPPEQMAGLPVDVLPTTTSPQKGQPSLLLRYKEITAVEKVSTVTPVLAEAALVLLAQTAVVAPVLVETAELGEQAISLESMSHMPVVAEAEAIAL